MEMVKALLLISRLLFKMALCESYADMKLSINWPFDGTLNLELDIKNLRFIMKHFFLVYNKGIGDAGSTADIRMLCSAIVCLGLLKYALDLVCYSLPWSAIVCLGLGLL